MKRKHIGMFLLAALPLFASCSTGTSEKPEDKKDTKKDTTVYSVSHESDEFVKVTGSSTYLAGEEASVLVNPIYDAVRIDDVYYNGTKCTKGDTDNKYIFTMPSENVTIKVDYSFTDKDEDGFLSWKEDNPTTLKVDDALYFECDLSNFVSCEYKVFSTNENVIKTEDLTFFWTFKDKSNMHIGGGIIFGDNYNGKADSIHDGMTQIVLAIYKANVDNRSGCIAKTVTVRK